MKIRLGFSPAPDGGIMFYGLAADEIDTGEFRIEPVSASILALNDRASRGGLEATMISAAAYPYVRHKYVLARCGACFAHGRGPVLAAREPIPEADLAAVSVAVPDSTSSAYLALQLNRPGVRTRLLPADKIAQAAKIGLADCALLPHCDSSECRQLGLHCVADLASSWAKATGNLPLPLTCLVVRNDIDPPARAKLAEILRASIRFGLAHRREAVQFAMACCRNGSATPDLHEGSFGVYVSDSTVNMGASGRSALEELLRRGRDADILPNALPLEFVGDES